MSKSINLVETIYQQVTLWLDDIKEHELVNIIEVVEKAKTLALAAEALPEEKVKQFIDNLRFDLKAFYHLNKHQAEHSLYIGLINERLWLALAEITDKSQVEWAEFSDELEHNGEYHAGDIIGFGVLTCQKCQQSLTISHLTTVGACLNCQHESFNRLPYQTP